MFHGRWNKLKHEDGGEISDSSGSNAYLKNVRILSRESNLRTFLGGTQCKNKNIIISRRDKGEGKNEKKADIKYSGEHKNKKDTSKRDSLEGEDRKTVASRVKGDAKSREGIVGTARIKGEDTKFMDASVQKMDTDIKKSILGVKTFVTVEVESANQEDDIAKTHFPEFNFERNSDDELSDDETRKAQEEKYQCKEDEDVAVFLSLASRMSIDSLIFIMQGQARARNLPNECLYQHAQVVKGQNSVHKVTEKSIFKPKKIFRFAEAAEGKVCVVVKEVVSWKDQKELWYDCAEMANMRAEFVKTVQFFRKYRPIYIQSVEFIANSATVDSTVEGHMKQLTNYSYGRGMEAHIVKLLHMNRKRTVEAVLEEQLCCRLRADDNETTLNRLRDKSLSHSQLSTLFSEKMGQVDRIDALKASMSMWRPSAPGLMMSIGSNRPFRI